MTNAPRSPREHLDALQRRALRDAEDAARALGHTASTALDGPRGVVRAHPWASLAAGFGLAAFATASADRGRPAATSGGSAGPHLAAVRRTLGYARLFGALARRWRELLAALA